MQSDQCRPSKPQREMKHYANYMELFANCCSFGSILYFFYVYFMLLFITSAEKLIKPQEWNHLAVTYDANTHNAIIYINGTEQVRGIGHGLLSNDWSERVGIGRHKGSRFLDGQVDEFKLYDKALSKDQVAELSNQCDFSKYCKCIFN